MHDSSLEIRLVMKPWNNDKQWVIPYGIFFPKVVIQERLDSTQRWRTIESQAYRPVSDGDTKLTDYGLVDVVDFDENYHITIKFDHTFAESFDNGKTWKVEIKPK